MSKVLSDLLVFSARQLPPKAPGVLGAAPVLCMAGSRALPKSTLGLHNQCEDWKDGPRWEIVSHPWMQHLSLAFIKFRLFLCMFVATPCFLLCILFPG